MTTKLKQAAQIDHLVPWRPTGYKELEQVQTAADKLSLLTWRVGDTLYVHRQTRKWGRRWVAYLFFNRGGASQSQIYGRPRVRNHHGPEEYQLLKLKVSAAQCEVCGHLRRATECGLVACGGSRESAMTYMVCNHCRLNGSIERTREAGYYVGQLRSKG